MVNKEQIVQEIVARVLKEVTEKKTATNSSCGCSEAKSTCDCKTSAGEEKYIFENPEDAIQAAKAAHKKLKTLSLAQREKILDRIREKCVQYAEKLSTLAVAETGMGNVKDKITKHHLVAAKTPGTEDLTTTAWSGDGGLTLVEQGAFGVILGITPSTNPTATVICNAIGMIAAGNTVVFAPHPGAAKCSQMAVQLVNKASVEVGGPENIVTTVKNPTIEATNFLMKHKDISLIAATGGPGVVTAALSSGKRALGAGAGNPPVVVDETADIEKAAKDILAGATFDNNLPCIAEKEVVVVESVADELLYYMQENGAYLLRDLELVSKLEDTVVIKKNGKMILNRDFVGKDAKVILKAIGIDVDDSIKCIIFEGSKDSEFINEELMMPILGIVRAKDVDEAIEIAIELEHGNRHSAHMHSKNIDNLTKFGRAVDTAIFVKNAPSFYALGVNAEGYTTFTIASRTGEGLTSAKTFTKSRRCVMSDGLSIR